MPNQRIDSAIGRLALLVMCLLAAIALFSVAAIALPGIQQFVGIEHSRPGYSVGETIDVPTNVYSGAQHTVMMFMRSSCTACIAAKPLFRTVATRATDPARVVIAVPNEPSAADLAFANDVGIGSTSVIPILQPVQLASVPTIIVVDRAGKILAIHEPNVTTPESLDAIATRLLAAVNHSSGGRG